MRLSYFTVFLLFCFQQHTLAQTCIPDEIIFTSQAQIDDFGINYPNCSMVEGNVIIENYPLTPIDNLNGLSNLTSIGEKFLH